MENQNIRVSTQWEHSITNLSGHDPTTEPGIALRQWVHHQCIENHVDLLSWEEDEVKANPTQQVISLDDHVVEFWGLQPLIPLLQYVNRLGFEICSVNRTRKLGYVNLNWPRCSARVTESLALTDGSFC